MLSVGDTVVYGTQGVCTLKEIAVLKMGKTKGEYYILSPLDNPGGTVYVPTANETLTKKLLPVMTEREANELIDAAVREPLAWISGDNERKNVCDDIVKNGSNLCFDNITVNILYCGNTTGILCRNGGNDAHTEGAMSGKGL